MRQGRVDGDRQRRGAALHFATASPPTEGRWSWEGSEAAEHAAASEDRSTAVATGSMQRPGGTPLLGPRRLLLNQRAREIRVCLCC